MPSLYHTLKKYIDEDGIRGVLKYKDEYVAGELRDYIFPDLWNSNTILHTEHTYESAQYLIVTEDCSPRNLNEHMMSPLYYQTSGKVIKLMIEHGANIDIRPPRGISLLFGKSRDMEAIQYLVREHGLNPFKTIESYNALDHEIMEYFNPMLIEQGINIYNTYPYSKGVKREWSDGHYGYYIFKPTTLIYTGLAFIKNPRILHWLFGYFSGDLKTLINTKNVYSENALFHVRCPVIMEELLKAGCNPNCINIMGYNLLQYHRDLSLIKVLLKYGANIRWRNPHLSEDMYTLELGQKKYDKYINNNLMDLLSVYDHHKYTGNTIVYKYLKRYGKCLMIQRNWRKYISKKNYVPPENMSKKVEFMNDLVYMPPDEGTGFMGGKEYIKGMESYMEHLGECGV